MSTSKIQISLGTASLMLAVGAFAAILVSHPARSAEVGATTASITPTITLYVSLGGNDQNAGTTLQSPLATLERAVALAKTTYKGQALAIRLRGGQHPVSNTIVIDANAGPLDIGPYASEKATLMGAHILELKEVGEKNGFRLFRATIPASIATTTIEALNRQSMMRVNGGAALKARFPNSGFLTAKAGKDVIPQSVRDQTQANCPSNDPANPFKHFLGDVKKAGSIAAPSTLPADYDLSNAFINIYMYDSWGNSIAPVRKEGGYLVATAAEPFSQPCFASEEGSRYFLENIPQALDAAEEFYIDPATRTVEWLASRNIPASQQSVVAFLPITGTLIKIVDGTTRIIWGLKISDTLAPMRPQTTSLLSGKKANVPAIAMDRATDVVIRDMSFTYVGTTIGALSSKNISILNNSSLGTYATSMYVFYLTNALVANNSFVHAGLIDKDGRGINAILTDSLVTGNHVEKTTAAGITCAACTRTTISYNIVREAATEVSDTGALHTGGTQESSIHWQGNYVYTVVGKDTDKNGVVYTGVTGIGFYPDTGANNQTLVGNILAGQMQHDAMVGMFNNKVLNNLLLGQPLESPNGSKIRSLSAYETRTAGTLTVKGNFAFVPFNHAGKYQGQTSYGGMPMLLHWSTTGPDLSRVIASDNSFVKTRALSPTECSYIQTRVDALAPYMRKEYCTKVATDLSYLGCSITAPTTCATKSSITAPLVAPVSPTCSVSAPPSAAEGGTVVVSWNTTDATGFSLSTHTDRLTLQGTTSLTIASTTQIVGEVFGLGGYATCSTTVTAFTGSGVISGVVYLDNQSKNFAYDSGETVFSGRTIVMSGARVATTTTNADGTYTFTGLSPGNYRVAHTVQNGYVPATDNNSPVTVSLTNSPITLNFGIRQSVVVEPSSPPATGSIAGVVYDDVNPSNFQYDSSEPVLTNRTIVLSGLATATTTTDSSGRYVFNGLKAGLYRVRHDVPSGYAARTDNNSPATVATSTTTTLNFGIKSTAISTTTSPGVAP